MPAELVENKEVMSFSCLPSDQITGLLNNLSFTIWPRSIPVHVFNGLDDEKCIRDAEGWKKWAKDITFHEFAGGHMFLLSHTEEVAERIFAILNQHPIIQS